MPKQKPKILVAEDEKAMAQAMELKLENHGFAVTTAQNGSVAIQKLQNEHFDLILCDLMMPKTDGFGVLLYLQKEKIATPVIILSALSNEEDVRRALSLGAKKFFVKSDTPLADVVAYAERCIGS